MNGITGGRRTLPAVAGAAVLVAALVALGTGPLAAPPLLPGRGFGRWLEARDPVTAGIAAVRLVALVVALHLLVTTSVAAAGVVLRRRALVRLADAWTLPPFRGALARTVGLGLGAATVLAPPVVSAAAAPSPPAEATARADGPTAVLQPTPGEATLRLAEPEHPPTPGPPTPGPSPEVADDPRVPAAPVLARTHVVQPGDHLWSLAHASLAEAWGHQPGADAIAHHWERVVAANPQLVDPDLLFPGDVVTVPVPENGSGPAISR